MFASLLQHRETTTALMMRRISDFIEYLLRHICIYLVSSQGCYSLYLPFPHKSTLGIYVLNDNMSSGHFSHTTVWPKGHYGCLLKSIMINGLEVLQKIQSQHIVKRNHFPFKTLLLFADFPYELKHFLVVKLIIRLNNTNIISSIFSVSHSLIRGT